MQKKLFPSQQPDEKIIIVKSTAPPTLDQELKAIAKEALEQRGLTDSVKLHFAREPEFLREGKELEDLRGGSGRIVIGADDPKSLAAVKRKIQSAGERAGRISDLQIF